MITLTSVLLGIIGALIMRSKEEGTVVVGFLLDMRIHWNVY